MTMPTPTLVTDGEKAEIKVKAAYSGYRTLVFSDQEHFVMFMFSLLQENTCDIHKVRNPSRRTSKWDASNLSVHAWSRVYDEMDWWRRCVFLLVAILNYLFYVLLHFFQVIHAPSLLRWKLMKLFVCMKWTMTQKSLSMVILYRMCILKLKLISPPPQLSVFPSIPVSPGLPCFGEDKSIYRRGARRWRKLYRVNGHLFQAKRFNRVSLPTFPFGFERVTI